MEKLIEKQQEMLTQQTEMINQIMAKLAESTGQVQAQPAVQSPFEIRSNAMTEFVYNPDEGYIFATWYARYEDLFELDAANMGDAAKARVLIRKLDSPAYSRFANYILPRVPHDLTFNETVTELKAIFGQNMSVFNTRFKCLQTQKSSAEDMVTYAGRVNRACEEFQLATITADQFKALIFVAGLSTGVDADVRRSLMVSLEKDANVNLKSLTEEACRVVSVKNDITLVEQGASGAHSVRKIFNAHQKQHKSEPPSEKLTSSSNVKGPKTPCWFCGGLHYVRLCEYKSHKCGLCKKIGHKDGFCGSASKKPDGEKKQFVKQPKKNQQIFHVSKINAASRRRFTNVDINGVTVSLQLDSASDITIISESTWRILGSPMRRETGEAASNASGGALKLVAEVPCLASMNGKTAQCRCFISNISHLNVLGIEWFDIFGLWDVPIRSLCAQIKTSVPSSAPERVSTQTVTDIQSQFADVFAEELGTCTKTEAKLHLKPGARPVYRTKRPVPYAALEAVEAELDRLEDSGVLSKVEFSEWAAPIVVVKKADGGIRICADFSSGLNDALETNRHPLPLPDDIFATLAGGTVFSNIDLADAYLQVAVHADSKHLLTVNTHRGLYRYNRLCFGVKASPGIFQEIMDAMLADMEGVVSYLDDVIVVGHTLAEHDRNLAAVLQRIREWGFRLRADKCRFRMKELRYLGFIIDANGRRPNPDKVAAIVKMPVPNDVSTLRAFIGMVNYYGQFLRNLTELRAPFDKLLTKDAKFVWSDDCQQSFEEVKALLQSDLLLTHFDPTQEIRVAADASSYGLGAVIFHRFADGTEKAIAHASRSMSAAERNYGQVEKEALAIVFAMKKFHKMLFGRRFYLSTDHKPLLAVFGAKKGVPAHTANRLQRWALLLLAYDFVIDHVASTKFGNADALSRLIGQCTPEDEDWVIATVQLEADVQRVLVEAVRNIPVTANEIAEHSKRDATLRKLASYQETGWPTLINDATLQKLHRRRDAITCVSGCMFYSDRVIIPFQLQSRVLKQLHEGHPGMVRMKALARSFVFWPDIDEHIETLVRTCQRCASAAKAPVKSTLASWPIPSKPWSRLHMDYAGPFQGHNFLIVVDALTKWPEVFIMASTTSSATIKQLRELFARFGAPECIVSDNGTQFVSAEMKAFFEAEGVLHVRSAPFHPQSNGQAERFVDTVKRALKKAEGEGSVATVLQSFLKAYRSTPLPINNSSPAKLMFGREIRTVMSLVKEDTHVAQTGPRNTSMEQQFNQQHGAVSHTEYRPGDKVYVFAYAAQKRNWTPATIIKKKGTVMYAVRTEDGRNWVRHTNQMRARHPEGPTMPIQLAEYEAVPIVTDRLSTQAESTSMVPKTGIVGAPDNAPIPEASPSIPRRTRDRRPPRRLRMSLDADGRYKD